MMSFEKQQYPMDHDYQVFLSNLSTCQDQTAYFNQIEPLSLVQSFIAHPPHQFKAWASAQGVPMFSAEVDLLMIADDWLKQSLSRLPWFNRWRRILAPAICFVGTTASEYALFPTGILPGQLVDEILTYQQHYPLVVIKDLPLDSPFLDERSNTYAKTVRDACKEANFTLIDGQTLAYVPIDFLSINDYLGKFSRARRKDIKRKLRVWQTLEIKQVPTGSKTFHDAQLLELMYALYLNVYQQSKDHFDLLNAEFFKSILQAKDNNGLVFFYHYGSELIGYNLCFIYNGNLVDKYIGLLYPKARELNLYFISWMVNLEFALNHQLKFYIAGWSDPEIKAYLGAQFTLTQHAIYIRNPLLRALFKRFSAHFSGT